jgi:hypothetical protein
MKSMIERLSRPGSRVFPIFSNTDNDILLDAFGPTHKEIKQLLCRSLGIRIKAMIRNCDFSIFDISGYKPRSRYCLNVIHELGIATAYASDEKAIDGRLFYRKSLRVIKDVSNLQGELPLASGPYRSFPHLRNQLAANLLPMVEMKRRADRRRRR